MRIYLITLFTVWVASSFRQSTTLCISINLLLLLTGQLHCFSSTRALCNHLQTAIRCFIMAQVKTIAVTGATGSQGGGVINIMKKTPGWKVRAVTRNPESDAARKLSTDGSVEVVRADWDDEGSLVKAFEVCVPCFPGIATSHRTALISVIGCRVSLQSSQ